jgi:hypothetical protein
VIIYYNICREITLNYLLAAAAIGWSAINYHDLNIRAVAVATVLMVGQVGCIIAAYLFPSQDAPRYGKFIYKHIILNYLHLSAD